MGIASLADRTDGWLVERCQDSADEQAFAEIVRRYRQPVFRLAVSVLGQGFVADAEDVAQDVLIRVHSALPAFRGESSLASWIYRIAFNHALSIKGRVRYRVPHLGDDVLAAYPAAGHAADDVLQRTRRQQALVTCMDALPEAYQSALRLHYWLGTSMAEIAEMLDVPENTVKSYLYRARRLLQTMLQERGFDA